MKIGVLCFRFYDDYDSKSELALCEAGQALGHEVLPISVTDLSFSPRGEVLLSGKIFPDFDVLISQARVIDQVENRLFWIKLLEEKGFCVLNSYAALCVAKNKWKTTAVLQGAGISTVPTWVVEDEAVALKTAEEIGYPVVVKTCYGTFGLGVAKASNEKELRLVLARFWKADFIQPLLLQPFIAEAEAKDHRVFVVGDRAVASMGRTAPKGDFRVYSPEIVNEVEAVVVSKEEADLAVRAVFALGLDYAGVDVIQTKEGPAVLEVNGNPGLLRTSKITEVDIPKKIIELAVQRASVWTQSRR